MIDLLPMGEEWYDDWRDPQDILDTLPLLSE